MNNEEMSDIIQKISGMINNSNNTNSENSEFVNDDVSSNFDKTSSTNIQDILNNFNFNSSQNEDNSNENNFNFDFETIMKMKNIMEKFNSTKGSPESNLLLSLKPYLSSNKKQKLDQYIQFLNITKVIESFNLNGGVNNK